MADDEKDRINEACYRLEVLIGWYCAACVTVIAIGSGAAAGLVALEQWGLAAAEPWTDWAQYVGIGFLLWATTGALPFQSRTWKGETAWERLDNRFYNTLHFLGAALLAFSVAWGHPGRFG